VALTGFVSLIPISLNGIGLMEGSFVFLCAQIGLPVQESAIAIFIYRIMTLLYSAACGLIYFFAQVENGNRV
jgi:uncharacterized membrane protein YbhN (UPF0104 family)